MDNAVVAVLTKRNRLMLVRESFQMLVRVVREAIGIILDTHSGAQANGADGFIIVQIFDKLLADQLCKSFTDVNAFADRLCSSNFLRSSALMSSSIAPNTAMAFVSTGTLRTADIPSMQRIPEFPDSDSGKMPSL